jgi:hypothetical protein
MHKQGEAWPLVSGPVCEAGQVGYAESLNCAIPANLGNNGAMKKVERRGLVEVL